MRIFGLSMPTCLAPRMTRGLRFGFDFQVFKYSRVNRSIFPPLSFSGVVKLLVTILSRVILL